jgi:hypothetical protein
MASSNAVSAQQLRLCAEFKDHCGTEGYDLTGDDDWCDIDSKYYVKKNKLYQGQVNCHSLDFLINTWESQLTNMPVGWPSPTWPKDPYTGVTIPIAKLLEYTNLYERISQSSLPDKLSKLIYALRNPNEIAFQLMDGSFNVEDRDPNEQRNVNRILFELLYTDNNAYEDGTDIEDSEEVEGVEEAQGVEGAQEAQELEDDEIEAIHELFVEIFIKLLKAKDTFIRDSLTNAEFENFINNIIPRIETYLNSPQFKEEFGNLVSGQYRSPLLDEWSSIIINFIRNSPIYRPDYLSVSRMNDTMSSLIYLLENEFDGFIENPTYKDTIVSFVNNLASSINQVYNPNDVVRFLPYFIKTALLNYKPDRNSPYHYINEIISDTELEQAYIVRNDNVYRWLLDTFRASEQ